MSDFGADQTLESMADWVAGFDAEIDLAVDDFSGFGINSAKLDTGFKLKSGGASFHRLKISGPGRREFSAKGSLDNFAMKSLKGKVDWQVSSWPACNVITTAMLDDHATCDVNETSNLTGHLSLNQGVGNTSVKGAVGLSKIDLRAGGIQALWRNGGDVTLKGTARHRGTNYTFDGSVKGLGKSPSFAFDAKLDARSGVSALSHLGMNSVLLENPLTASGKWQWSEAGWQVEGLDANVGGTRITGAASVTPNGTVRAINANFTMTSLDLESFAGRDLKLQSKSGAWSTAEITPLWAEDLRGTVEIDLVDAQLDELKIPQASLKGSLGKDTSEWALYQGKFWGGAWTGKAIVSRGTHGVRVEMRGAGEGLDLAQVTKEVSGKTAMEGRGSLRFVLEGSGKSALVIAKSLEGQIDVESASGRMLGFDLPGYALDLGEASGALGVQLANEDHLTHGTSEYRNLLGRFSVRNGIAHTAQWQSTTDVGGMHFNMDSNFASQSMMGRAEFNFQGLSELPTFAYAIQGWGETLSGSWDTWALEELFEAILEAERAAEAAAVVEAVEQNSPAPGEGIPSSSRDVETDELQPLQ